jgi:hypothetical protein
VKLIVLDSTPLGLLTQRPGATEADACRRWLAAKTAAGVQVIVPEIVDYELRRELIRSSKRDSIKRLDAFVRHLATIYLPINSGAMRLAAALWAKARQAGMPTSPHKFSRLDMPRQISPSQRLTPRTLLVSRLHKSGPHSDSLRYFAPAARMITPLTIAAAVSGS